MPRWIACLLIVILTLPLAAQATTDADGVVVRAEVIPGEAWIGQRVVLQVDVLAAEAWAQLAGTPRIELPGTYVLPPRGQGVRLQETIEGRSHSGQRYEFFIYPQRDGNLVLRDTRVEIRVRQLGGEAHEQLLSAVLPEVAIQSRVPPGADGINGLISTTQFTADQRWEPADGVRQVGEAVRRIIRLEASDVSGMAFLPLDPVPVEGFGIYPEEPEVDDRFNRGELTGSRTEALTYVAEQPGEFELPAIGLIWWDTDKKQLRNVDLPGMRVTIEGGSAVFTPSDIRAQAVSSLWWIVVSAAGALLLFLLRRPIARQWRAAMQAHANSELRQFRKLRSAIGRGQPAPAMRELMHWLDRINDAERPARIDRFIERYGDPDTRAALAALQQALDQGTPIADRRMLAECLTRARRLWQQTSSRNKASMPLLPPLNGRPREG